MSVRELRHDRPSGWFSKSRGLPASVSFLSSPPPLRSFTCAIFRAVFDSRSSCFAPKPHGNACYAGYVLFGCLLWTLLSMIVVGEILHLQAALGLNNCVRYRCNRPRLYLTEEHSIRGKFCLVNHKLFHLACVACACERSKVKGKGIRAPAIFHLIFSEHRRFDLSFHPFEDQRKLTACHSIQKCTKKLFRNSFGWVEERLMQFWAK